MGDRATLCTICLFVWKFKTAVNKKHIPLKIICSVSTFRGIRVKHKILMKKCVHITVVEVLQFSRSVVSYSLRPHESQHARPPCPLLTPGVHSSSCPSSQWWHPAISSSVVWHPAISSSVVPFSSCPQALPASGSFPMSQLFAWGGQSIGVSASASVHQWTPRTDLF